MCVCVCVCVCRLPANQPPSLTHNPTTPPAPQSTHTHRVVKAVDDAILGSTAPLVALYLSYVHGLPRALNRVQFEKDLRMPLPRRKGDKERHSLSFMLLHPADSGRRRKYPTILVRNPYGRLSFFYSFYLFAQVCVCFFFLF
jgi:hypothetical protein